MNDRKLTYNKKLGLLHVTETRRKKRVERGYLLTREVSAEPGEIAYRLNKFREGGEPAEKEITTSVRPDSDPERETGRCNCEWGRMGCGKFCVHIAALLALAKAGRFG